MEKGFPSFTKNSGAEVSENKRDETGILRNQDMTQSSRLDFSDDENMGAKSVSLNTTETDQPGDFARGEIDVLEQMDRAADAVESSIQGWQNQGSETSPRTELGASWKHTPGGLEEVEQKTDEYLASHGLLKKRAKTTRH